MNDTINGRQYDEMQAGPRKHHNITPFWEVAKPNTPRTYYYDKLTASSPSPVVVLNKYYSCHAYLFIPWRTNLKLFIYTGPKSTRLLNYAGLCSSAPQIIHTQPWASYPTYLLHCYHTNIFNNAWNNLAPFIDIINNSISRPKSSTSHLQDYFSIANDARARVHLFMVLAVPLFRQKLLPILPSPPFGIQYTSLLRHIY